MLTDQVASDSRARFEREVRAASALTHPHICAVYDVGEANGHLFFVMELVEGTTLREYARQRLLDHSEVVAIGVQIADALAFAHTKGVVHRDIKPGNIMITGRLHVKVLDFGLALQVAAAEDVTLERLTKAGAVMGTLHYMSPEVLQGANADVRSNVWALGVVLYELLTGRPRFQGRTSFEVSADILRQSAAPLPPSVPLACDRLSSVA